MKISHLLACSLIVSTTAYAPLAMAEEAQYNGRRIP
jgi:hypothetical protein